jgi:RHS repeat-associated protein
MEMPALSYQAPAMNKNRYLYNQGTGEVTFDTERIPDLNIDLTKFRAYDPALGRWWQVDPKASELSSWTPYNYSFNNPVLFNDPLGDCPPGTNCESVLKGVWNSAVAAVGFVKDTWNSGGKNVVNSVKNTYEFGQFAYNSPQTAKGILADGIKGEVSNRLEANNYDPIAAASEAVGEVLGGVALGALGDKGLSKLGTLGKVANVLDDVGDAAKTSTSFFSGTKYTNKVLGQIKKGDFHAFPESVKAFESNGVISTIKGGDGVTRQMLKIPGEYGGKKGFFEFIKEADGSINHRLFRPNP